MHVSFKKTHGASMQSSLHTRSMQAGILCLLMFLSLRCQNINEPNDVVVGEGFTMRVVLQSQSQEPITSARLDWRIITKIPGTTLDSSIGDWKPFSVVAEGEYSSVVPVQLSDTEQRVVVRTTYTGSDVSDYASSLPYIGRTTRYDTSKVCGNARIVLNLVRTVPPLCCGMMRSENLRLSVALPAQSRDSAATAVMILDTLCASSSLTLNAPTVVPADPALQVFLRRGAAGSATLQTLPQSVTRGESFQLIATYTAGTQSSIGLQQYSATVLGSSPGNASCITIQLQVQRFVSVNASCSCPQTKDTTLYVPADSTQSIPLCVGGTSRYDTLKLPSTYQLSNNADSACIIQITLDQQSIDPDVSVVSFNGSSNFTRITLAPKERLRVGPVFVALATRVGTITARLRYRIQVVDQRNTTTDCGYVSFVYKGLGEVSRCEIDSARSTIFKRVGGRYVVDTLSECVSTSTVCANDPAQPTNSRTLVLRNPGRCPVTVQNPAVSNAKFNVSSSKTVIHANDTVSYSITFTPRRTDLWPSNRGSAPVPFHTALLTSGCSQSPLQLIGKADSCPQSVGLNLRQWALGSKYYEGIVIKPARAEKSGDARALGNGAEIFTNIVNALGGTLDGGTYVKTGNNIVEFLPIASNVNIVGKVCESYPPNTFVVLNSTSGWQKSLNFRNKDVVAFRKENDENGGNCYQYGILWIQQIDADGANPGAFIVTLDFCYPM